MAPAHRVRYDVLDSWRGIAAIFVALYHFRIYSNVSASALIQGSYLFVDFFFVLSGFVITANYMRRLSSGSGVGEFVLLRFGRLYPLHIFMLATYVSIEIIAVFVPYVADFSSDGVFASERNSPLAIVSNLLLIHSLGIHQSETWNLPSWSISVEFYSYILFAAVIYLAARHFVTIATCIMFVSIILLFLTSHDIDVTYDYGIFRCLAGFFAGCLCHGFFQYTKDSFRVRTGPFLGTAAEASMTLLIYVFIANFAQGRWSLAAPFCFAAVVFVFAFERGLISGLLKGRCFVWLGAVSYSVYMTHQFVQARILNVFDLLGRYSDNPMVSAINGAVDELSRSDRLYGDIAHLPMILVVVALSYLTYRFVESPFRGRFRRMADRVGKAAARRLERPRAGRAAPSDVGHAGQLWSRPRPPAFSASPESGYRLQREQGCGVAPVCSSPQSDAHLSAGCYGREPAQSLVAGSVLPCFGASEPVAPERANGVVSSSIVLHTKGPSGEQADG